MFPRRQVPDFRGMALHGQVIVPMHNYSQPVFLQGIGWNAVPDLKAALSAFHSRNPPPASPRGWILPAASRRTVCARRKGPPPRAPAACKPPGPYRRYESCSRCRRRKSHPRRTGISGKPPYGFSVSPRSACHHPVRSGLHWQYPYSEMTMGFPGKALWMASRFFSMSSTVPGYQVS